MLVLSEEKNTFFPPLILKTWESQEVKKNEEGKVCPDRYLGSPLDFPGGSDGKASAYNTGDPGSIPGSGRSPGEGNGNPLQCSCLEKPMDGGAWWATVHGAAKSGTRLSHFTLTFFLLGDLDSDG